MDWWMSVATCFPLSLVSSLVFILSLPSFYTRSHEGDELHCARCSTKAWWRIDTYLFPLAWDCLWGLSFGISISA